VSAREEKKEKVTLGTKFNIKRKNLGSGVFQVRGVKPFFLLFFCVVNYIKIF